MSRHGIGRPEAENRKPAEENRAGVPAAGLFGTDGIRGRAGEPPLDPPTVWRIGRALARRFSGSILIGRDTRQSGPWIEEVLRRSLESAGAVVRCAGVLTTPGTQFLTQRGGFQAGIVISASHNPFEDNGIKVFGADGQKLDDATQDLIEGFIAAEPAPKSPPAAADSPSRSRLLQSDAQRHEPYLDFLTSAAGRPSLSPLKIVLDCANGAACRIAPEVFRRLGAQVVEMNSDPDGKNINLGCGALHPEAMGRQTAACGADMGAAFDGDADRVIFADEQGRLLDGDHILLLLARRQKRLGRLPTSTVVTTVMANMGLEAALRQEGIGMLRTPVGDRWVWQRMQQGGHALGGEQSGHIILRDALPAGDGILVTVKVASLTDSGRRLSEARRRLVKYPQLIINVPVTSKPDFRSIPAILQELNRIEGELQQRGRVVVRYSGTEPLARIMLETEPGIDPAPYAESLAERFREALG